MLGVGTPMEWTIFGVIVLGMLALDLSIFNREAHQISMREAVVWSIVWVALALAFNVYVYYDHGDKIALQFLTAYLVEKSLSVDNLFVFLAIFNYFHIGRRYQHRVLFWGVLGALIMRAIFLVVGVTLLNAFDWMMYIFGAFLVYTGIKLGLRKDEHIDPSKTLAMRLATKYLRTTHELYESRFFIKKEGVRLATPLFLVLIVVEFTDVVFAVDSVPAVLAISNDLFIVYTSNVFAILGLRALFFVLAGVMDKFRFLGVGLSFILVFIGVKMMITDFYHIPTAVSLGVIAAVLLVSIASSVLIPKPSER
ncbi:MAG: TerC family protein [Myxococcota bacterium]